MTPDTTQGGAQGRRGPMVQVDQAELRAKDTGLDHATPATAPPALLQPGLPSSTAPTIWPKPDPRISQIPLRDPGPTGAPMAARMGRNGYTTSAASHNSRGTRDVPLLNLGASSSSNLLRSQGPLPHYRWILVHFTSSQALTSTFLAPRLVFPQTRLTSPLLCHERISPSGVLPRVNARWGRPPRAIVTGHGMHISRAGCGRHGVLTPGCTRLP